MRPILLSILLASCPALAYHPLTTDDTGTQGLAGNQLEIGYDQAWSKAAGVSDVGREIPLTYTRGIHDALDVFVGAARAVRPANGWGNVGIGAKWRFFESEADHHSLALKPEILLPVSAAREAAGFGYGATSYGLTLIYSRETAFGEVHANLAWERGEFDDPAINDRRNLYRVSIAPVWAVAEGWKLALDLGLMTNPDRAGKSRMGYMELGLVYSPSEDLDLGVGVTRDLLDGDVSTTSLTLGVTWRFR